MFNHLQGLLTGRANIVIFAMSQFTLSALIFLLAPLSLPARAGMPAASDPTALQVMHRGVETLVLRGTRVQMAAQHGQAIRGRVEGTALPYFADKIASSIRRTYIAEADELLGRMAIRAVDVYLLVPLRRSIPGDDLAVLDAFSVASGFDYTSALSAHVVPDAGQWLIAQLFHGNSIAGGAFSSPFGCSSVVVAPSRSSTGGLIHGRNLDYDSYGTFDQHPVMLYFLPNAPSEQAYMSVTSTGIHTAGITAMNESGIVLTLHQAMVDETTRHGPPVLGVTERVVRQARTLEEAAQLIQASRFAGAWRIIVSSVNEGTAATFEVSARGVERISMTANALVETNHAMTESMRRREFSLSFQYFEDTRLRRRALESKLSTIARPGVQDVLDLVSGTTSEGVERTHHGIPAKMNNIQSVIFDGAAGLVWMAVPTAAGSKPTEGNYIPFPTPARLKAAAQASSPEVAIRALLAQMPASMHRSAPSRPERVQAHALYRRAAHIATDQGRWRDAYALIREAAILEPMEAFYVIMAGATALRAAGSETDAGRITQWISVADRNFRQAMQMDMSPYHQNFVALLHGRVLDSMGDRTAAMEAYRRVDRRMSRPLANAADGGLSHAYASWHSRTMTLDYIHADVLRF